MRLRRQALLAFLALSLGAGSFACKSTDGSRVYDERGDPASAHVVRVNIVQLNDVYEIAPVEGGTRGGLARVATLLKKLELENPNTFAILSGDFVNPSAISSTKLDGKPVAGAQMIATLNAMGLDYVALGNHEFDIPEAELKARIGESKFKWVTANVLNAEGAIFPGVDEHTVLEVANAAGDKLRLALVGVCTDMAKKPWVKYKPVIATAKEQVLKLEGKADVIVALTHLSMADDKQLAAEVPELAMLLGGHEHENASAVAGADDTPIYKADANARTVYLHQLRYDTVAKTLQHQSKLLEIDATTPEDPETAKVAKDWLDKVYASLRAQGVEPTEVIGRTDEILEGFEAAVRNRATNFTRLVADAFLAEDAAADAVVFHGGTLRIDDRIPPGDITRYDVVRIFPFGGKLVLAATPGAILKKALDQGVLNRGSGGFLHHANILPAPGGGWLVKGVPLDETKSYKVLYMDFLMTGMEKGLAFLNPDMEGATLTRIRDTRDVRTILTAKLASTLPAP